jgi:hypothetical protein
MIQINQWIILLEDLRPKDHFLPCGCPLIHVISILKDASYGFIFVNSTFTKKKHPLKPLDITHYFYPTSSVPISCLGAMAIALVLVEPVGFVPV